MGKKLIAQKTRNWRESDTDLEKQEYPYFHQDVLDENISLTSSHLWKLILVFDYVKRIEVFEDKHI